jgi:hypothetical protein
VITTVSLLRVLYSMQDSAVLMQDLAPATVLDATQEVAATIGTTSTVTFAGWLDPAVGTGSFATAPAGLTPSSLTVVPVTGTYGV